MDTGLDDKTLEEFDNLIIGLFIPKLLKIADDNNIDRDSMVKFAAYTLSSMSELATFENYKIP